MNELSCLLFPPFSLFYLTPPNTLDIFISRLLFPEHPLSMSFSGDRKSVV